MYDQCVMYSLVADGDHVFIVVVPADCLVSMASRKVLNFRHPKLAICKPMSYTTPRGVGDWKCFQNGSLCT